MPEPFDVLARWVHDARARTLEIYGDLAPEARRGPKLSIVNPPNWELGHVAWFMEYWVLRHVRGGQPMRPNADTLWDSMKVAHDTRWDLPLPPWAETMRYLEQVRDRVLDGLGAADGDDYFVQLSVLHEDMHIEAFNYTRQTHGYPAPRATGETACPGGGPHPGDVDVPGGTFRLGATGDEPFVFDNEKWAHPVSVEPFSIARAPVTQSQFCEFVADGGYRRRELWSEGGWRWREIAGAEHPVYWDRRDGVWMRRHYATWRELEPDRPIIHVNHFEADAYCRWADRRLPTEAEWELAACGLGERKPRFPWGDSEPTPGLANLDASAMDTVDVGACRDGDSPYGCRQMIGNVWEWTSTVFGPYPGFVADPYADYSVPWFGDHMVLRGGCYVTRGRLLRNTWRNYATPDRRDVLVGFRTCR